MEELIKKILSKKELRNLDKEIVLKELKEYFKKNSEIKKRLEHKNYNKKSSEYKQTVKEVRNQLREIYGVFIKKKYERKDLWLEEINENNKEEIIKKLLKLHQSSEERADLYPYIYQQIKEITGPVKKIIDLACGLNPLSYIWIGYKPKYLASDLSEKDLEFISKFFRKLNIKGETKKINLIEESNKIEELKGDICYLFKTVDSLETKKKNSSKELIENIKCKWIIVSFPTKSIGGRKEIKPEKRNWFYKYLKEKKFEYQEFEIRNELFIVIKKKS